jgi:DNA-binding IclR family transcriptional regulator
MPVLLQLRRDCGERTNLSLFDRTTLVYAIRLHGKRESPQHSTLIGKRVPTYCSAGGRATLSRLPDEEVEEILGASDLRRVTPDTLTDPERILDKVREAREFGYAFVKGEISRGELVVAAPIVDAAGRPLAAVHIAGSSGKWGDEDFRTAFAASALEAAKFLSHDSASVGCISATAGRSDARGS